MPFSRGARAAGTRQEGKGEEEVVMMQRKLLFAAGILTLAIARPVAAGEATHPLVQWTFGAPASEAQPGVPLIANDLADIADQGYPTLDLRAGEAPATSLRAPVGYEMLAPSAQGPHLSGSWGWQARSSGTASLFGSGTGGTRLSALPGSFTVTGDPLSGRGSQPGTVPVFAAAIGRELNIRLAGFYDGATGGSQTRLMNAVASGALPLTGDAVTYAVEGNWQESRSTAGAGALDLWNVALYMGTEYGPTGVDVRLDYTDDQGILTTVSTDLWSLTVTGSLALVDEVDFRVEYRHDEASGAVFGQGSATGADSLNTVQARVVWRPEP
jgi:hypothetical protein